VSYIWGVPTVVLLVATGFGLTFYLGTSLFGIQGQSFFHSFSVLRGKYDNPDHPGDISHFQALTTALSATVGIGNIGGVALVLKLGGPGALFWMILTGLIGMATKFAESTLAINYRKTDEDGNIRGGPMYYIEMGLGKRFKPMAIFYAVAIAVASYGFTNMFQTNQCAEILKQSFGVPKIATGIALAFLSGLVIIGGIRRIGRVTSFLVPFMAVGYVLGCLVVIGSHFETLPVIVKMIFTDAFTGSAVAGGAVISIQMAMLQGVRRACFSNEAGLGSTAIAHAAAVTDEPVREGVVASLGPFIDTVIVCTLTGLVILSTNVHVTSDLIGVPLTAHAFDSVIPGFGGYFIAVAAVLFAFSTMVSWSYYGETSIQYSLGKKYIIPYKIIFCILAVLGSIWSVTPVINFSDIMTGLMIVPNLIAVIFLAPKIKKQAREYFRKLSAGEFKTYS
jgi:AGCS family alanine or glycine:cation symporter